MNKLCIKIQKENRHGWTEEGTVNIILNLHEALTGCALCCPNFALEFNIHNNQTDKTLSDFGILQKELYPWKIRVLLHYSAHILQQYRDLFTCSHISTIYKKIFFLFCKDKRRPLFAYFHDLKTFSK